MTSFIEELTSLLGKWGAKNEQAVIELVEKHEVITRDDIVACDNIDQDSVRYIMEIAASCMVTKGGWSRLPEDEVDDFAIWHDVNPWTEQLSHYLRLGNRHFLLHSGQVALLRELLVFYDETKPYSHSPADERKKMNSKLRFQVLARDNYTCRLCGSKPTANDDNEITLHVDHVIPVSKGGRTEIANLMTLCSACNNGKSDEVYTDLISADYLLTPPLEAYTHNRPVTPSSMDEIVFSNSFLPKSYTLLGFFGWMLECALFWVGGKQSRRIVRPK